MKQSIIELQDPRITCLGVEAITDFYRTIAIDYKKYNNLLAITTGCDSPFLNVVIDTRTESSANYLNEWSCFFKKYKIDWSWMLTPIAKQNDLIKEGFVLLEESPAMYFDLIDVLPSIDQASLIIKEMDSDDNLLQWIEPIKEGFPSKDNGETYHKLNVKLLQIHPKKLRHFIGIYQDEVIIAGTLFLSETSCMLHNLATKGNFQRRGFGKELTLYLLQLAKGLGYQHCFLESSSEGFNLYHQLGFKIYSTISYYQCKSF